MNINYKEPQFELFPAHSAALEDINKPKFLLATMTLSTESLVILAILAIMIGLFAFSLGVEQGKHLAAQALDQRVSVAWNVGGRRLAAATVNPPQVVVPVVAKPNRTTTAATKPTTIIKTAAPANKWTVQLATYRSENYAQQEALGLKAKGYPVFLIKVKDFYFVCAGQYGSQAQADAFLKKVQAKYQGSQVRRF